MTRSEGFFQGHENTRLYYQMWTPAQSKGHLVITHGQAEHSDCYVRLVEALAPLSWTIYAWDLRGHGRSDGQRGYVKNFADYVQDYAAFLNYLRRESKMKDPVLLGHSMGGLIQTTALLENSTGPAKAQVLSSPMFGVAVEVPLAKDLAALVLSKVMPQLTMGNQIVFTDLTRDPEVIAEFEKDEMRHDRISSSAYLGAIAAIENVRSNTQKIRLPTLIQIPDNDPVVGSTTTQTFFQKWGSSDKTLKEYPDRKHEIYNDLGREEVFADLIDFLKKY